MKSKGVLIGIIMGIILYAYISFNSFNLICKNTCDLLLLDKIYLFLMIVAIFAVVGYILEAIANKLNKSKK